MEKGGYSVISCGRYLEIQEIAGSDSPSIAFTCPEEDLDFWFHYFDFHTDYQAILNAVRPEDAYLAAAGKAGNGIRILRQDLWEMIITFIISQQKTIPAIRQAVEQLSRQYGSPIQTVPSPSDTSETDTTVSYTHLTLPTN